MCAPQPCPSLQLQVPVMATAAAIPTRTRILFSETRPPRCSLLMSGLQHLESLGRSTDPKLRQRRTTMKEQDRVLIRRGARELTPTEADLINGGLRTLTVCTIGGATAQRDGDVSLGEC